MLFSSLRKWAEDSCLCSQDSTGGAQQVMGQNGLDQGRYWNNTSPETPVVVVSPGPFKAISIATTILRTEDSVCCGLWKDGKPGHSHTNFQHTDMHPPPSPPSHAFACFVPPV
ncbi:hypothetical protein EYF80_009264 [Liparis tanakae]|uniref:Uncharacterized protein n=1 Tax=Liparis tanakae TaxID=230148 RepID=A0A4Z2IRG7_9TELE|nr:hypothetical protein EYF80_009264 [Liparis tanakae]